MQDDVDAQYTLLIGCGVILAVVAGIAWLKGTVGHLRETAGAIIRRRGEPWTWALIAEPVLALPIVVATAAVGLAHPDSHWAAWFYNEAKMDAATRRYGVGAERTEDRSRSAV